MMGVFSFDYSAGKVMVECYPHQILDFLMIGFQCIIECVEVHLGCDRCAEHVFGKRS
jgi:hypothetical protein